MGTRDSRIAEAAASAAAGQIKVSTNTSAAASRPPLPATLTGGPYQWASRPVSGAVATGVSRQATALFFAGMPGHEAAGLRE